MKDQIPKIKLPQHAVIVLFVLAGIALAVMDFRAREQVTEETQLSEPVYSAGNLPITPIPLAVKVDERKVLLGERLYNEPRLSQDNTVSCATCHELGKGGTDQMKTSLGINDSLGPINSPTTFNSGFFFSQFWDGRAKDLAEQAAGPVNNPLEMGSNWPEVIGKLSQDPAYVLAFEEIYADGIRAENITDAIAEFEKSLITPNCRLDKFLRGDKQALNDDELDGYRLFKEYGCISCHQGVALGGNMYQTLGVMEDYFTHRQKTEVDFGRFNVTGKEWNRYQFKVPTLRNIELTYPYLHDGSAENLEDVLQVMWKSQLGRSISPEESVRIVKFLKTLTGTYNGEPL
jgi:cytochrome c peroxidase